MPVANFLFEKVVIGHERVCRGSFFLQQFGSPIKNVLVLLLLLPWTRENALSRRLLLHSPVLDFKAVLRIRIRRIRMFLNLPDPNPDPLVQGTDPAPDPAPDFSIIKQKE
jgi:hypothetical protein